MQSNIMGESVRSQAELGNEITVGRPFPLYGGFIETHSRFGYIDEDNGE